MPYVIKRYANRKLYDTRTKRYLTLDEVGVLVRAGEDVKVEDADTGEDITGVVLSKIVAEHNRKGGSLLVPPKILVDLIQRPSETVIDAVRTGVTAGQRTVEQMSGEVGRLLDSVTGRGSGATDKRLPDAGEQLVGLVEERLHAALAELGLPTRDEFNALAARVAVLEAKATKKPPARAASTRTAKPKADSKTRAAAARKKPSARQGE